LAYIFATDSIGLTFITFHAIIFKRWSLSLKRLVRKPSFTSYSHSRSF